MAKTKSPKRRTAKQRRAAPAPAPIEKTYVRTIKHNGVSAWIVGIPGDFMADLSPAGTSIPVIAKREGKKIVLVPINQTDLFV